LKKEVFTGILQPHFPKRTEFCIRKTPTAHGIASESADSGFRKPTNPDTASSIVMTPKTAATVPSEGGAIPLDHMPHNQENAIGKRRIFSYEV
jgi:hypothetical protein